MDDFEIPAAWLLKMSHEKIQVKRLGDAIGYGRMMQCAQECWKEVLQEQGFEGGEFAYGPCVGMTVPCGCKSNCDWCCGSGWLTKHVKQLKDEASNEK